jgi:hypothetical protein
MKPTPLPAHSLLLQVHFVASAGVETNKRADGGYYGQGNMTFAHRVPPALSLCGRGIRGTSNR